MTKTNITAAALALAAAITCGAQAQTRVAAPRAIAGEPAASSVRAKVETADTRKGTDSVDFWLTVLHFNDGESKFLPLTNVGTPPQPGPFAGASRFKTLMDTLRAEAAVYPAGSVQRGSVTISSGDNFLAGATFAASLQAGVPYLDSVMINLLQPTAVTLGNHEFDFGPGILANFINGTNASIPFLSANLNFSGEPALAPLAGTRLFSRALTTVNGRLVGIVGATTPLLPFISSPGGVGVNPLLPIIQNEVDALTAQGARIIILSSHLQNLGEELALVPQLRDVDIVIGGGGSELVADNGTLLVPGDARFLSVPATPADPANDYPRVAIDSQGRQVPVVTTTGDYKYIGRLIVGFDAAGNLQAIDPISNAVRVSGAAPDAVATDPAVDTLIINPVNAALAQFAANVVGTSEVPLDGTRTAIRSRETNLGNLTADALLWSAMLNASALGTPMPDVALQNSGGIRNNNVLFPAATPLVRGNISELNTFDIFPFANFVAVVHSIPPARFKEVLENAVSRVAQGDGRFAQIAGFRFTWDAAGTAQIISTTTGQITTPGSRVREVVLNDGRVIVRGGQIVPGAPSVNVALVDFLARGGDQYPLAGLSFNVFAGETYQDALRDYIQVLLGGNVTQLAYPVGGEQRIRRLN